MTMGWFVHSEALLALLTCPHPAMKPRWPLKRRVPPLRRVKPTRPFL